MNLENLKSKHFELVQVKDGIYAAIAKEGGGAIGNAGFVDLGDQTIVFDTFNTQQAAIDLKHIAESITNRSVDWVINSHWHGDHIRGNQVYKDSKIISSVETRVKMLESHPERIRKQKEDIKGLISYIKSLEERNLKEKDLSLENQINFLKEIETSLHTLELVLPNFTFKEEFTFYGTKKTAKLFTFGGGHSNCDSFLYIPEDKTVFMGDLLFVNFHPSFFLESNPLEWKKILEKLAKFEIEKVIPGHGVVGTKREILTLIRYFEDILELSTLKDVIEEIELPKVYESWSHPEIFQTNLKMLKTSFQLK
ncbi:MBL fold metallo-hydrolase [Gottfriedia luciferensis]|uniref:MBL fold metallo-hydrolase n=1 Tax=Gottfriedia luciferensis TaxID=178774 RepID=UPI000B449F87|nr:MBL fold metallo-hydrolase [Gottfriedia luciferensis]